MRRTSFASSPARRSSATRSAFDTLVIRDEYAFVTVDRYVLFVWRTQLVRPGAEAFIAAVRRSHTETNASVGTAVFFCPQVDVAHPPEVRSALVQGFGELRGAIGASAIIRAGGGFPAAVLRSSVTSMQLEHRNSESQTAHFTGVEAGLRWLSHTLHAPSSEAPTLVRMLNLLAEGSFDALGEGWQREDSQR